MQMILWFLLACFVVAPSSVHAVDAARYIVYPTKSESIDPKVDHVSLSLLKFSISTRDNFFKRILSSKKNGAVTVKSTAAFFDKGELSLQRVKVLQDLSGDLDRVIGQAIQLQDNVPADAQISYSINVAFYRESKIDSVLQALDDSKAGLPKDLFAAQWVGYTKAVSVVLTKVFGLSDTSSPFSWEGDLKTSDVLNSKGEMREHYIILVAPYTDGDKSFKSLRGARLAFDEAAQQVSYDGKPLKDWSHAVLKVSKAEGVTVKALIFESGAPWAILAQSQFLMPTLAVFDSVKQIKSAAEVQLKALNDQLTLLKGEHRFSKFDRAIALQAFAKQSLAQLVPACAKVHGNDTSCGISALKQFLGNVNEYAGLIQPGKKALGQTLDKGIADLIDTQSSDLSNALLAPR